MKQFVQKSEEPSLAFGGQAIIEGVIIRSKSYMVVCVRQSNNEISTIVEKINSTLKRYKILGLPFLRGIVMLFETLYTGIKGLYFSANASLEEEGEEMKPRDMVIAVAAALALAILLFTIIPFLLTTLLNLTGILFNVVEGMVRLTILLLYFASLSLVGSFKRILQYHGAEHTIINAYEAGVDLNVANVKEYSRFHPRCGTSFLFIVALVSIMLFSIMPDLGLAVRLAYRILLTPLIGSISYEILRLSDRYKDSTTIKILTAPGLGLQYLTTRKPDKDMLEVALKALKETIILMQNLNNAIISARARLRKCSEIDPTDDLTS